MWPESSCLGIFSRVISGQGFQLKAQGLRQWGLPKLPIQCRWILQHKNSFTFWPHFSPRTKLCHFFKSFFWIPFLVNKLHYFGTSMFHYFFWDHLHKRLSKYVKCCCMRDNFRKIFRSLQQKSVHPWRTPEGICFFCGKFAFIDICCVVFFRGFMFRTIFMVHSKKNNQKF